MRYTLYVAAAAAVIASASPAFAQSAYTINNATAKGTVLLPLTLTESQKLDFGTVIASGTAGNVVIDPDSGGRTVGGGVSGVPSYPGQRGLFQGAGSANQDVIVTLTPPTVLTSGSNSITVTSMSFDSGATNSVNGSGDLVTTRTIDATGAFDLGVGGDFAIGVNQANGVYQANYSITADYQ